MGLDASRSRFFKKNHFREIRRIKRDLRYDRYDGWGSSSTSSDPKQTRDPDNEETIHEFRPFA